MLTLYNILCVEVIRAQSGVSRQPSCRQTPHEVLFKHPILTVCAVQQILSYYLAKEYRKEDI